MVINFNKGINFIFINISYNYFSSFIIVFRGRVIYYYYYFYLKNFDFINKDFFIYHGMLLIFVYLNFICN